MENIYAFGVDIMLIIQKNFVKYEDFFTLVNEVANPHTVLLYIFPFISIFDSLFACEILLVASVGEWLNSILKWILVEHRPFWWIKETKFYGPIMTNKPSIYLGPQTCETGPGCPSGHVMSVTYTLALFCSWLMIMVSERNEFNNRGNIMKIIKYLAWFISFILIIITSMARLFISTHFPHQCLLGIIFGLINIHLVSHYYIPLYMNIDTLPSNNIQEKDKNMCVAIYNKKIRLRLINNILIVLFMITISFTLYWGQKLYGFDPLWSVKLAFKWCPAPEFLHVNTTPLYSLVLTTSSALGWTLCVTPSVKKYRYNTKNRSLIIAGISAIMLRSIFLYFQELIPRDDAVYFYLANFILYTVRPIFFLRFVPLFSVIIFKFWQKLINKNVTKNAEKDSDKKLN